MGRVINWMLESRLENDWLWWTTPSLSLVVGNTLNLEQFGTTDGGIVVIWQYS